MTVLAVVAWALVPALTRLYLLTQLLPGPRQVTEWGLMWIGGPLWLLWGLGIWLVNARSPNRPKGRLLLVPAAGLLSVLAAAAVLGLPESWTLDRAIHRVFDGADLTQAPATLAESRDQDFQPGCFVREDPSSTASEARLPLRPGELRALPRAPGVITDHRLGGTDAPLLVRPVRDGWWFVRRE